MIKTVGDLEKAGVASKPQPDGAILVTIGEVKLSAKLSLKAMIDLEAERGRTPTAFLTSDWQLADMVAVFYHSTNRAANVNPPDRDRALELLDRLSDDYGQMAIFFLGSAIIAASTTGNKKAPTR